MAVVPIEGADGSVAEIAYQEVVAVAAKVPRRQHNCPRLIQVRVMRKDQSLFQVSVRVVNIDGAVTRSCRPGKDLIRWGIFHIELILDGLDIEGVVVGRQPGVGEAIGVVRYQLEIPIVNIDLVVQEIGRVQEVAVVVGDGQAEVKSSMTGHGDDGMGAVNVWTPTRDAAVNTGEQEDAGSGRAAIFGDVEAPRVRVVVDDSSRV